MPNFTITLRDQAVRAALDALAKRVTNPRPVLDDIGQDIVQRAQHRFVTSTGPDGQRWKPNSAATLAKLIGRVSKSKSNTRKDGALSAKGLRTVGAKRPLVGESHRLERQISHSASARQLVVKASTVYAAMQQFGGHKSKFPKLWGDIPARPFLPIKADGSLYPQEQSLILKALNAYLSDGA